MAMSERQIQKEILRLKKDIDLLESQAQSGMKSKADKEQENSQLDDDTEKQETENTRLAEELENLESSIGELDDEFKENQLKAGTMRKQMNIIHEDLEKKKKEEKLKRAEIENQLNHIEQLKKKIKEEKRSKETAEYNLRKTNAKVAEIQTKFSSRPVTIKIARDARRAGRKPDEIQKSQEDIDKYDAAVKESQLAKAGAADNSSDEEKVPEVSGLVDKSEEVLPPGEEKKDSGLDLDF